MPKVCEIFYRCTRRRIFTGIPSVFVRFSNCNLRCVWCDSKYASWKPEGENLDLENILKEMDQFSHCNHVVITGGEPMMAEKYGDLTQELKQKKKHITIETNGTIFQPILVDLVSISLKLKHSIHQKYRICRKS